MKSEWNQSDVYEIRQQRSLPDIHSEGILLRHKKSGARVMLLKNDDENKVFNIAFRTPPADSIAWYTVEALTGDSLALRADRECTLHVFSPAGEELYRALKERGVLVRHFGGRIADYIRITIGSSEEMKELLCRLKEIL